MKRKLLFIIFLCIATGFTGVTTAWGQVSKTVSPGNDLSVGSLADVTDLELSGNWNGEDMLRLRAALRQDGGMYSGNAVLEYVTCAEGTEFTGTGLSLEAFFYECAKLISVQLPVYSGDAVSLRSAFHKCSSLKRINSAEDGVANLSDFTGGITDMYSAFNGCSNLSVFTLPGNTEDAVNLSNSFYNCGSLKRINSAEDEVVDLSAFSGGISNMNNAFRECSGVTAIMLPGNLSDAVNFSSAFYNCASLSRINSTEEGVVDLTNFTGGISSMINAFYICSGIKDLSLPGNLSGAVDFSGAFYNCASLKSVNSEVSGVVDLKKFSGGISNMNTAFYMCSGVTAIMMPGYTGGAIDLAKAFRGATSLERVNSETPGVVDLSAFSGGIKSLWYTFMNCAKISVLTLPGYSDGSVDLQYAFTNCTSLSSINSEISGVVDLSDFTGGITDMYSAFNGCSKISGITLPDCYSGAGVNMGSAFNNCTSLQIITRLEKITSISSLNQTFKNCYSLGAVELGGLPAESVSNLGGTFEGTNPNCLKYLPEGSTIPSSYWSTYSNFIIGNQSHKGITLLDRSGDALPGEPGFNPFYCHKEFTVAPGYQITYTRPAANLTYASATGGWNTLILPFDAVLQVDDVAKTPVTATQKGDYWLRPFISATANGEAAFADTEDGLIRANVPYLLALPGDSYDADLEEGQEASSLEGKDAVFASALSEEGAPVTVKASDDVDYSTHKHFSFRGAFIPQIAQPMYLLTAGEDENGDSFVRYTEGNVASFRAYFTEADTQTSHVRQLRILGGNEPTGLNKVPVQTLGEGLDTPRKVWTKDGLRIIKGNRIYDASGVQTRVSENE